ncbi:hypothetical protein [Agathobaculum hominis]
MFHKYLLLSEKEFFAACVLPFPVSFRRAEKPASICQTAPRGCAGRSVPAFLRTSCTVCRSVFQPDKEYGHSHAYDKGGNANYHIRSCAVPQQHRAVALRYRRYAGCLYASEKNADTGQKKQAAQCQAGKQPGFIPLSVLPCPASDLPHPGFRLTGHPIPSLHSVFREKPLYLLKDIKSEILPPKTKISSKTFQKI